MTKKFWIFWGITSILIAGYYGFQITSAEDKTSLLIGETSTGHYQIELDCVACHKTPFGGIDALQEACMDCHGEELENAHDSHEKSVFTDPRNADRVEILDARYCVNCHTEHKRSNTLVNGLTLPGDICFHCHQDIGEERPSHEGMAYDTCASSGCHNFHDNRALYEDFLLKHADEPVLKAIAQVPERNSSFLYHKKHKDLKTLTAQEADNGPHGNTAETGKIIEHWAASSHASHEVNCSDCHQPKGSSDWIEKPGESVCASCHKDEYQAYTLSKHGMRQSPLLNQELTPITPGDSHLVFNEDARSKQHGCMGCHNPHEFNTQKAAVDSCLECHSDNHSVAFLSSPHYKLFIGEQNGELPEGSGVTCATCHMPRVAVKDPLKKKVLVQHNQNDNFKPNSKMIRTSCMNCHGLGFSIDALADKELIENNFSGHPQTHILSIDMAVEREQQKTTQKSRKE